MKKFIAKAVLVVVAAAGLIGIAGAPAAASHGYPCINHAVCLFEERCCGQEPSRYVIVDGYNPGFCFNIPPDWDNRADKVKNLTVHVVSFFTGNYCTGTPLDPDKVYPGTFRNFAAYDAREANSMLFRV